ncbi:hypothetical protein ACIQUQ_15005 [Streptomyces sp. NPDC101118]|uniref:hypothetical protein n=1 Tax=Streptomyces sp. NPDC101118 TaxID=3366109 RepID=UPI00380947F2
MELQEALAGPAVAARAGGQRVLWDGRALTAASLVSTVQVALVWHTWALDVVTVSDEYGRDPGYLADMMVLAAAVVLGPLVALGAGLVLGACGAMLAASLGRLPAARIGGPRVVWTAVAVAAVAAAAAVPLRGLGASFPVLWGWAAGMLAVPVLAAELFADGRRLRGLAVVGAMLLVLPFQGWAASLTFEDYRSPELSPKDYAGLWTGEGGSALLLQPEGRAEFTSLAYADGLAEGACTGEGTWEYREPRERQREGVALSAPGCPEMPVNGWEIAGTAEQPELFLLVGDPDDGDVRVLRKNPAVAR